VGEVASRPVAGENVEDVTLAGPGVINGNKVFDPTGEEKNARPAHARVRQLPPRHGARPHFLDAANYAVFFQISDDVEFRNVRFIGGWDGIHWRGAPDRCATTSASLAVIFRRAMTPLPAVTGTTPLSATA